MKAVQITEFGGPEVMKYQDVADPTPGEGEAVVEIQAAGVNFTDVYSRQGINPGPPLPRIIGVEGAGVVKDIGPGVTEVKIGDDVTYCTAPGTYAELAIVPAWRLMKRPSGVDAKAGAAAILQGMTAHYLCHSTYAVQKGDRVIVHAGAGGMGLLLTQMIKKLGGFVFSTVSTEEKAELSKEAGADLVIFDTAGRLQIDDDLVDELRLLKREIDPHEILLVADSALGQEAVNVAKTFHEALTLTGLVLTKVDGDARGGAALRGSRPPHDGGLPRRSGRSRGPARLGSPLACARQRDLFFRRMAGSRSGHLSSPFPLQVPPLSPERAFLSGNGGPPSS